MKNLSLKLDEKVFLETQRILMKVKKSRNKYINEAVDLYNKLHKRKLIAAKLRKESALVAKESLKVLSEFEKLDAQD